MPDLAVSCGNAGCCSTSQQTRDTFKLMVDENIGQKHPLFYSAYAAFEEKQGSFSFFFYSLEKGHGSPC